MSYWTLHDLTRLAFSKSAFPRLAWQPGSRSSASDLAKYSTFFPGSPLSCVRLMTACPRLQEPWVTLASSSQTVSEACLSAVYSVCPQVLDTDMAKISLALVTLSLLASSAVMGASSGKTVHLPDGHLLKAWYCGCSGTCYFDSDSRGATGYGDNIGIASSDCQHRLQDTCQASGGLKTYVGDTCSETTA